MRFSLSGVSDVTNHDPVTAAGIIEVGSTLGPLEYIQGVVQVLPDLSVLSRETGRLTRSARRGCGRRGWGTTGHHAVLEASWG